LFHFLAGSETLRKPKRQDKKKPRSFFVYYCSSTAHWTVTLLSIEIISSITHITSIAYTVNRSHSFLFRLFRSLCLSFGCIYVLFQKSHVCRKKYNQLLCHSGKMNCSSGFRGIFSVPLCTCSPSQHAHIHTYMWSIVIQRECPILSQASSAGLQTPCFVREWVPGALGA